MNISTHNEHIDTTTGLRSLNLITNNIHNIIINNIGIKPGLFRVTLHSNLSAEEWEWMGNELVNTCLII